MMRFILLVMLSAFLLSGCGNGDDKLAEHDSIDADAPVKAETQIVIAAPADHVWDILSDIRDWPRWQADIVAVSIARPAGAGVRFEWSTGTNRIYSRLALYEPERQLGWTGRLLVFHAIHIWTITPLPGGSTLVQSRESMRGWPIAWLYSSGDLLEADRRWLRDLKKRAES